MPLRPDRKFLKPVGRTDSPQFYHRDDFVLSLLSTQAKMDKLRPKLVALNSEEGKKC